MNLYHTGLSELYKEIETLGDPLTGISDRIDFEKIRPILSDLYENDTEKGGRPNYDPILMVKILLLQQWYNLSDPQVEREIRARISFLNFLGYPEKLPDRNTICYLVFHPFPYNSHRDLTILALSVRNQCDQICRLRDRQVFQSPCIVRIIRCGKGS